MRTRHARVATEIVNGIQSGEWPVGALMPSEKQLAEQYAVSRATIRQALDHVAGLGLIERRQGAGTRVLASRVRPHYVHRMIASGDLMEFAGPSRRRVHVIEDLVADEEFAPRLDGRAGRRWMRVGQTRHVETLDLPVCWTDVYVASEHRAIRSEIEGYAGLIYALVEERLGVTIVEIAQELRAIGAPAALAQALTVAENDHALELTRRYFDAGGTCHIVAISVLPSDRYAFRMSLSRMDAG